MQMNLVEGINNDVTISQIENGGHIFCVQPLHPTYQGFRLLEQNMNNSYSSCDAPSLPVVLPGTLCVACIQNNWYRVQVCEAIADTDLCLVKFVDYGGFVTIPVLQLRQIRTDMVALPFQAIECVLSNIKPTGKN